MRTDPKRGIRGLASADFIMSLPLALVMVLVMEHAGNLVHMRQDLLVATRTAAWMKARNGLCLADAEISQLVRAVRNFIDRLGPLCEAVPRHEAPGMDEFWDDQDPEEKAAEDRTNRHWRQSWRLFDDPQEPETILRDVKQDPPAWTRAYATGFYWVTNLRPSWFTFMEISYIAPDTAFWTYNVDNLKCGYDPVMRESMEEANALFPGIFRACAEP